MTAPPLVLASTSPYRRDLLARLRLPFVCDAPQVDESRHPGESPADLVLRLARAKARAVAGRHPEALIVGSDQVACLAGEILGKPLDHAAAVDQLTRASGQRVAFHTGLCVLHVPTGREEALVEPFQVHFRPLTPACIDGYLARERPYDCAGSFKSEGLGIALFERLEGDDPTALIGLPLIRLVTLLDTWGVSPLGGRSGHGLSW